MQVYSVDKTGAWLPGAIAYGAWVLAAVVGSLAGAAEHLHEHSDDADMEPPPRVFLDKSERIVWFQLNRLTNARLLRVERSDADPKYKPVHEAILKRPGMSMQHREEALRSLVKLSGSDAISVLFTTMDGVEADAREGRRVTRQLAGMALSQDRSALQKRLDLIRQSMSSKNPVTRSASLAALLAVGEQAAALQHAKRDDQATLDLLGAVVMTRDPKTRNALRESVVAWTEPSHSAAVRKASLGALGFIEAERGDTFDRAARLFNAKELRDAAVNTLLRIPQEVRSATTSQQLLLSLVEYAEATPAEQRTTDDFIDAMQLADQLLAKTPVDKARGFRERLRAVTVRVIRIRTVQEEMRYDVPFFAVEAGRPVQIVLQNEDLMPHNLVVATPGKLREVAEAGALVGPDPSATGKAYVPNAADVLEATSMVPAGQQTRLTFTAPATPGEYPYVCTFPRHWMRMYGVMVVVSDLAAWNENPVKPKDPTGNNRSFVKNWTLDDFDESSVAEGLRGRSAEIGKRIFTEATCAQCHKMQGVGGAVGPELTDVITRWKGDHRGVLREVLDPSHRVDPKYAVRIIITDRGKVISGVVVSEDKNSISLVTNPEDPKPITIEKEEIEDSEMSTKSLMPKALLDRFTQDEIFELLAYITLSPPKAAE